MFTHKLLTAALISVENNYFSLCYFSELLLDGSLGAIRDDGRGVSQHESGDPALGSGTLLGRRPEHQEHVLLVAGQDLDHLALNDADLILLHCHVVLGHQHGGYATAAATFTLRHRKETQTYKYRLVVHTVVKY